MKPSDKQSSEVSIVNDRPRPSKRWEVRSRLLTWNRTPLIMGIINVTPDSFSDGGRWLDHGAAVARGMELIEHGADILDIGGESTRPYSTPVSESEEMRRVIPVVQRLAESTNAVISIDTTKSKVAQEALAAGAEIINDVSGLTADQQMASLAAATGAGVCVMHMQGTPQTMQDQPVYNEVVSDVHRYLVSRLRYLTDVGISTNKIAIDPGIGFGKTHNHNWELIRRVAEFHDLGCPVVVGHSRKGFITKLTGDEISARDLGTLAVSLWLAQNGVGIVRLHEVAATRMAFRIWERIGLP